MKNLLLVRIPSICICFTTIILLDVIFSLLFGYHTSAFPLVMFFWLAVCQLIDHLMSKINFKSWGLYCIAESAALYLLSLLVFRAFFWEAVSLSNLLPFTIIFLITVVCVFSYFGRRQKILADEINSLLDRANK